MGNKSVTNTIGYHYLMDLHMGLCRGPVNTIDYVEVGGRNVHVGTLPDQQAFHLNRPDLFGGEEQEGGIKGDIVALYGRTGQVVGGYLGTSGMSGTDENFANTGRGFFGQNNITPTTHPIYPKDRIGGLVGDWRGVTTAYYSGRICTNNPYPKEWKFRVRRWDAGWFNDAPWYPEKSLILFTDNGAGKEVYSMNPAHMIYECMTNPQWGRGLDPAWFNEAVWRDTADRLYTERFGLCMKWNRRSEIEDFIQTIIDHIGGSLYIDRETGLFCLRLIRGNYDRNALPVFDYNTGLLKIEEDVSAAGGQFYNEIVVKWLDPVTREEREVRSQDNASRLASGATFSITKQFLGVPMEFLAQRVADRERRLHSADLKKVTVRMDRRGWRIAPGSVFRISDPQRGITDMTLRAGKIEKTASDGDDSLTITCMQDVFDMRNTEFRAPVAPGWSPPPFVAEAPTIQRAFEIPYFELARTLSAADLAQVGPETCAFGVFAARPQTLSPGFNLASRTPSEDFIVRRPGGWQPLAFVGGAGVLPQSTAFSISGGIGGDLLTVANGGALLVGDEIMSVQSVNEGAGSVSVLRGCADTIPTGHPVGTAVWFWNDAVPTDGREYALSEQVIGRVLTRLDSAVLDVSNARDVWHVMEGRQNRPYLPGQLRVNGAPYYLHGAISAPVTLSWVHRNRINQAQLLIDHNEAGVPIEPGVTYTIRFFGPGDGAAQVAAYTGLTGTSFVIDSAMLSSWGLSLAAGVRVQMTAVRSGVESWQRYDFTLNAVAPRAVLSRGLSQTTAFGINTVARS